MIILVIFIAAVNLIYTFFFITGTCGLDPVYPSLSPKYENLCIRFYVSVVSQ